jgi:decaprenylphospho-beta-D-ribofuranose 2-oxidase
VGEFVYGGSVAVTPLVSGWGRSNQVAGALQDLEATDLDSIWSDVFPRGVLARGLGRSYGDAAQNSGGMMWKLATTGFPRWVAPGVVRLSGGVSLDAVMRWAVPQGWFVPVTPGTRYVTVGGAIAADVHGKNHHQVGSFGSHIRRMVLHTPAFGATEVFPGEDLFAATVGGMGLTGVICEADVNMVAIETSSMVVDTDRVANLDSLIACLQQRDSTHDYTVAWVDVMARGSAMGRGVVTAGHHARIEDVKPQRRADPLKFGPRSRLAVPDGLPGGLLNRATVGAFNELWFRKAPRHRTNEIQPITGFFHPLDGVAHWNRLYGRAGFLQYQFVIPDSATDLLRTIISDLARERVPVFLAVLKRFGDHPGGLLSFPQPGWTLAVDLPAEARFADLLNRFDEQTVAAGGRIYLAKDSRLSRRHLESMYPNLDAWRTVRDRADPDGLITSDLDRRLNLSGRHL